MSSLTHKQKFLNDCELICQKQQNKLNILKRNDYETLLCEVKNAWNSKFKTTKDRRRMARYEVYDDNGKERLIKADTASSPKFVLTIEETFEALESAHASTEHGRRTKMIAIGDRFENVTRSLIEIYLKHCRICYDNKPLSQKKQVTNPIVMNHYGEKMQMDLIDLQSKSFNDYNWILVCQDHFTKWVSLRPLNRKQGICVAEALIEIFSETGIPERLQSDNGKEFKNQFVYALANIFPRLKFEHGAPRKPTTQGSVERANQDIEKMLYYWMKENNTKNWPLGLLNMLLKKSQCSHLLIIISL